MQRLSWVSIAALFCALGLAGCDVGRAPVGPSNLTTELSTPPPATVDEASTVKPWRCLAGGVFAASDCYVARRLHPDVITAVSAPGAPAGLTSTVSGSTVQLSWTAFPAGDAATSYVVEAGSASGLVNLANFDTGNAAVTLTVTSVPAGSYFVRVRARNSVGSSAPSNEVIVTVAAGACTTAPGTPTNLAAAATGASVSLSWIGASTGCPATGYVIEAGSASSLANLANFNTGATTTTFAASGVASGTYFVRVRAANAGGSSAPSNEVILTVGSSAPPPTPTPGPCALPSAPSGLAASVTGTTVALSWSAGTGAPTSYIVEVGTSSGASNITSADTGSAATSLSSTLPAGTYVARVRAVNACGTGSASTEVTFTIAPPACAGPSAPSGLTAAVSGSTVALSWTASSGAPISYAVEISMAASGSGSALVIAVIPPTTSLTTTLSAGTFTIRVSALNACGTSDLSNTVTVTVIAATPAVVTMTSSGVSPRNLTVNAGTQVTFVNNDRINHEMTSNPHPEHTDCPEINQVGFLVPGQSRQTGNLNTVRTCGYHDHGDSLNPAWQGTITIR